MQKKISKLPFRGTAEQEKKLREVIDANKHDKSLLMAVMQQAQAIAPENELLLRFQTEQSTFLQVRQQSAGRSKRPLRRERPEEELIKDCMIQKIRSFPCLFFHFRRTPCSYRAQSSKKKGTPSLILTVSMVPERVPALFFSGISSMREPSNRRA